jgi:hypothetical protein
MQNITTLEQLKQIKEQLVPVVDLGPFDDDQGPHLVAKCKKPNILGLIMNGNLPNPLMKTAMSLFENNKESISQLDKDPQMLSDVLKLMDLMARQCLVEPSYADLESVGIELSQTQLMNLLVYVQGGVNALEGFRQESQPDKSVEPISDVSPKAE